MTKNHGFFRRGRGDEDRVKATGIDAPCDDPDEEVEICDDGPDKVALVGVEPSTLTKAEKKTLVAPGSRLTLNDVRWPGPDERPCPPKGYTVALKAWFEVGLGLPIHPFIQTLVKHYQIELSHFSPNLLARVRVFLWLCEMAVEGRRLKPTVAAFDYFFHLQRSNGRFGPLGSLVSTVQHQDQYPVHATRYNWSRPGKKWFYLRVEGFSYTGCQPKITQDRYPEIPPLSDADWEFVRATSDVRSWSGVRDLMEEMTLLGVSPLVDENRDYLRISRSKGGHNLASFLLYLWFVLDL